MEEVWIAMSSVLGILGVGQGHRLRELGQSAIKLTPFSFNSGSGLRPITITITISRSMLLFTHLHVSTCFQCTTLFTNAFKNEGMFSMSKKAHQMRCYPAALSNVHTNSTDMSRTT